MQKLIKKPLDKHRFLCYIITMKDEKTYKVTMIDGPTTAIIPIKAHDAEHAVLIASKMNLGLVVRVNL